MSLRIYLAGRMCLESPELVVGESRLPGRQGRLFFACLVLERHRPVGRAELAEVLWPEGPPAAWEAAINALASKLRASLAQVSDGAGIASLGQRPSYQLVVPADTWVDVERAVLAADEAEAALRAGDAGAAWGAANVAAAIARRSLLEGVEGDWVAAQRARLRTVLVRGLDCLAGACLHTGELALARATAEEAIELEPFREAGYRRLMAVHAAAGNNGEALRVYERCRALLATELGAHPSPETEAAHRALLG